MKALFNIFLTSIIMSVYIIGFIGLIAWSLSDFFKDVFPWKVLISIPIFIFILISMPKFLDLLIKINKNKDH